MPPSPISPHSDTASKRFNKADYSTLLSHDWGAITADLSSRSLLTELWFGRHTFVFSSSACAPAWRRMW